MDGLDKAIILGHAMVPRHEVLKRAEAEQVLATLGARPENLPKIRSADPVVVAIGAKKGDILRITRPSPIAGEALYYRVVV